MGSSASEVAEETGLTCSRLYSAELCEQFYEAERDAISIFPVFLEAKRTLSDRSSGTRT